jgi:DNA polymerase I-like protein with 3'-5' exonuclease and polymerase domains
MRLSQYFLPILRDDPKEAEKAMLPAVQLKVPLVVEARAGKNWDEAH